jgi:AraC family transcriptional regulator
MMEARQQDQPFIRQTLRHIHFEFADLSDILYPACSRVPLHAHDATEVSLTLAGGYSELRASRRFHYTPATSTFRPWDEEHSVIVGSRDLHCFNVGFAPPVLSRLDEVGGRAQFIHDPRGPLSALMRRLYDAGGVWSATMPLLAEGLVLEILGTVAKIHGPETDRQEPKWIRHVEEIVRAEFHRAWTVPELAACVDIHPVHLSRTWRRFRGCSLGHYVHHLRVEAACRRMIESDDALADIALQLGFSDQPHFSQVFKRIMGMPPGAYRSMYRGRDGP